MEKENGTCLYSCIFLIEVEEVRDSVLLEEFSAYRKLLFGTNTRDINITKMFFARSKSDRITSTN